MWFGFLFRGVLGRIGEYLGVVAELEWELWWGWGCKAVEFLGAGRFRVMMRSDTGPSIYSSASARLGVITDVPIRSSIGRWVIQLASVNGRVTPYDPIRRDRGIPSFPSLLLGYTLLKEKK